MAQVRPDVLNEFGLKDSDGVLVVSVIPRSAAARAYIEADDFIITYGGKPVRSPTELIEMVTATAPGTRVPIGVRRYADDPIAIVEVTIE
ncbi:MAG: hypothetical protein A3H28_15010 [Acidobacteria bacterium RIFCSPLOWO2_02_FULL_61_28]|nr:MAG: hypothetical protein A3H28_15010 [Acidobacteria bacterium RIFCSPLOWO2_02_FULL_61_28]